MIMKEFVARAGRTDRRSCCNDDRKRESMSGRNHDTGWLSDDYKRTMRSGLGSSGLSWDCLSIS
ncbi:hypothetical protein Ccrd_013389 [Cynara cardunculus var. scolymus]|uniref:Uncharacterized protein n=1 Tax=Cynara cardunculus var. scolymus TaxID=59895 RepID=A0A103YFQ1_CYNCS|nr:hypothetical protein Ccrd_013389 [Cynara cardunculus var. scolymus]